MVTESRMKSVTRATAEAKRPKIEDDQTALC